MSAQTTASKERKLWSEWEDSILRNEVSRQSSAGPVKNWRDIAAKIPDRSNKDCRKRWMKLDSTINRGPWSKQEDDILRVAVQQCSHAWTEVARLVKSRNPDQCAKRWLHFLNPELDHSEWTETDDQRLLAAVDEHGHNWKKIVESALAGRSATDAKNRFSILTRSGRSKKTSQDLKAPHTRRRRTTASTARTEPDNTSLTARQPAANADGGLLGHMTDDLQFPCDEHALDFGNSLENLHGFSTPPDLGFGFGLPTPQHDFQFPAGFDPFSDATDDDLLPHMQQSTDYFSQGTVSRHYGGKHSYAGRPGFDKPHTPSVYGEPSMPEAIDGLAMYTAVTPMSLSSGTSSVGVHEDADALNEEDDDDDDDMSCDGTEDYYGNSTDQNFRNLESAAARTTQVKVAESSQNASERRKTVMLQNISSDLAKQVLDMVFSSRSAVTIKISEQD